MEKVVILTLGGGSLDQGFALVSAQVSDVDQGQRRCLKCTGSLPAATELSHCHPQWRQLYLSLQYHLGSPFRIHIDEDQSIPTNVSRRAFEALSNRLEKSLNDWLGTEAFRQIDQQIRLHLMPEDEIRVVVETDCIQTRQLPWHLWRFFEDYPQAEVALADLNYRSTSNPRPASGQVRILAILGNATGIDIQRDRTCLESLVGAETVFLVEPNRAELDRWLWDERGWDILFFAGHSASRADGCSGAIGINATDSLTIEQLHHSLRAAINQGLQLAIFNSCDGLGLARAMEDLNIPQLVVMREPVPDPVAQTFLTAFLQSFSRGRSFYRSVREAREKLQGLEDQFLCASWLPVICQNPATQPTTWRRLQGLDPLPGTLPSLTSEKTSAPPTPQISRRSSIGPKVQFILVNSLMIAVGVLLLRWTGLIEPIELAAYDLLLRQRPVETTDPRLLMVEITQADVDRYGYPLPDNILAQTIDKIYRFQPRSMGIDLHRALPRGQGRSELLRQFRQHPSLSTVCFGGATDRAYGAPTEFSEIQQTTQVGLSDLVPDGMDSQSIVRRHLLAVNPNLGQRSVCLAPNSLSLNLVDQFLSAEKIPIRLEKPMVWFFGDIAVPPLPSRFAAYQNLGGLLSQTLINYRALPLGSSPGQRVTLGEVLEDRIQRRWVRDRVILLGTTAPIGKDLRMTPYGQMPGVWIHGHMVSQLLSATLDRRPVIHGLPQLGGDWGNVQWGDCLWVWAWTAWGCWMVWSLPRRIGWSIVLVGAIGLYQICLLALVQGIWLPWVPTVLGLGIGSVALYIRRVWLLDRSKPSPWSPMQSGPVGSPPIGPIDQNPIDRPSLSGTAPHHRD
jgi:CHASE2 domain-containing sensor protein